MNANDREIRRKQRILEHAVESGNVAKTCRYFGIPRSSFYRWHKVYLEHGEEGLRCKKPIAKSHPNQTPDEIVEKILYLRAEISPRASEDYVVHGPLPSDASLGCHHLSSPQTARCKSIAWQGGVSKGPYETLPQNRCRATTSKWMLSS